MKVLLKVISYLNLVLVGLVVFLWSVLAVLVFIFLSGSFFKKLLLVLAMLLFLSLLGVSFLALFKLITTVLKLEERVASLENHLSELTDKKTK